MSIYVGLLILVCIVRSLALHDFQIDVENVKSPISDDIKQYVSNVISIMAEKHSVEIETMKKMHNNDINKLRTILALQEERISTLENEKAEYSHKLSDLENEIIHLRHQDDLRQGEGQRDDVDQIETNRNEIQQDDAYQTDAQPKDVRQNDLQLNEVLQDNKYNKTHTKPTTIEKTSFNKMQAHGKSRNETKPVSFVNSKWRIRRASTESSQVAFFATMTMNAEQLGKDQDIVFDHIVANKGNAYNGHHGTFVAPVSGTYVFSVTLFSSNITLTWGHVVANGVVLAKLEMNHRQSSQTVIVNLQAGDDVSIQNTEMGRGFVGDRYSTFSGFLLYEDMSIGNIVG